MKIILKQEVDNLGRFGDQVKVANGYARNYLIPQGLAVLANAGNLRQLEAERAAYLKKAQVSKEKAEGIKGEIEALTLTFARKTGEEDRLFGSVTAHDIEAELKKKGFELGKKAILLHEHIKTLGQFTVPLKLHSGVSADLKVEITKE
ncbi:MAG: 50S ribosomal protein L9 [Deltaproteobacteria bacterium]|nr:50S ribosomal protein L9 [Deltaproteobacteria bacterium]